MPPDLEKLVKALARLPGLGPRSARRAAIAMLARPDTVMLPLAEMIRDCATSIRRCSRCNNLDLADPCYVCRDERRDGTTLCVLTDVEDLWAFEKVSMFKGRYHVLGGLLSALDGRGPDQLGIDKLIARVDHEHVVEVIIALGATVEGQTTAHYLAERLHGLGCRITRLAHGLPVGGELNYLDEGTLSAALMARQEL